MYSKLFVTFIAAIGLSQALPSIGDALVPRASQNFCPELRTPPPGLTCGKIGELTNPMPTLPGNIYQQDAVCTTLSQCTEKCRSVGYDYCQSLSFNTASNECTFYSQTIAKQGFTPSASSTTTYYDANCFKCTSCQVNLLNGGWESDSTSSWFTTGSANVGLVKGYESKYAIGITSSRSEAQGIIQYIRQCANTNYNVDFDYQYTSAGSGSETLSVYIGDNTSENGIVLFDQPTSAAPAGVWHHATLPYTSRSTTNAVFYITNFGSPSVLYYIDNIVISLAT